MLASAIERSQKGPRESGGIYPAPWSPVSGRRESVPHIAHLGDEALLDFLAVPASKKQEALAVADLARRIIYRDEFRLLFTLDYEAASETGGPSGIVNTLRDKNSRGRKVFEETFARMVHRSPLRHLVTDARPVLVYCPAVRMQAKEVAAHAELVPEQVIALNRQQQDPMLREEIRILNHKYQQLWRLYLFVHPRIAMAAADPALKEEALMLFGSVVDAFCGHYGIGHTSRDRGSRLPYRSLRERVDVHWQRWPTKFSDLPSEALQRVIRILNAPAFWDDAVALGKERFPISDADFVDGFVRAIAITAIESLEDRAREDWPPRRRRITGEAWYTRAETASEEEYREETVRTLIAAAQDYLKGDDFRLKGPRAKWRTFVSSLGGALKRE
jgi:hypothetical protein